MTADTMIEVRNLSVSFPLYHGSSRSFKNLLITAASGRLAEDKCHRVTIRALSDIDFSLKSGERLGLIGSNGAGKSTLVRVLAGIYKPVSGVVLVNGTLNAMLDPILGMHMELTGRGNILLRGLYNGLSKAQVKTLEDDVIEFAELSDFIDLPARIYSAGMVVRLDFALATAIRPRILLMDEWFLAGDAGFLEKARRRLEEMVRSASRYIRPIDP